MQTHTQCGSCSSRSWALALTIDTAQNVGDFAADLAVSFAQHVPRRVRVRV